MFVYIVAKTKLCKLQYTKIRGIEGHRESFRGWPIELPMSAAFPQSESGFIEFPSSSRMLLNPIYFFIVVHAHPDIPVLMPIGIPEITVPQMKPVTKEGPPAIPINTIGPSN